MEGKGKGSSRRPRTGAGSPDDSKPPKQMAKKMGEQRAGGPGTKATAAMPARRSSSNPTAEARRPTAAQLAEHVDDLSSDDEEVKNTIGYVPIEWYKDYDHIGYDLAGEQVVRKARADGIDRFLASQDDPLFKWTIYDEVNDEEIVLSKRDVAMLKRIRAGNYGHTGFNAYPDSTAPDLLDSEKEIHPIAVGTEPKARFLPSKWEAIRIAKIVKAIKNGTYKSVAASALEREAASKAYLIWGEDDKAIGGLERSKYAPPPLPAPKMPPPGHAASYNPAPEFLLSPDEEAAWRAAEPKDRPLDFVPRKFTSLRAVPLYAAGIRERFERCLDLYLCPRATVKKPDVDPDSLLPVLPDPAQLRPFPTAAALNFTGHTGRVRCVCFDPSGRFIASGSDDGSVRLWETATGRCLRTWAFGGIIAAIAWNPVLTLLAVAVEENVHILYPGTITRREEAEETAAAVIAAVEAVGENAGASAPKRAKGEEEEEEEEESGSEGEEKKEDAPVPVALREAKWRVSPNAATCAEDLLPSAEKAADPAWAATQLTIAHSYPVKRLAWHKKGGYLAATTPSAPTGQVMIHSFTKGQSQCPFAKNQGQVQAVAWHPHKPLLYVANQRIIRVYNLSTATLVQKLESGAQWISGLDIHPSGDHVIAGSYDHRVVWFDTELGSTPYKTLRYHSSGVRRAGFHPRYPLMATASDDGSVHIFHAKVYGDFLQNPLVVPVKILKGHAVGADGLGVLDAAWHPTQPWLLSAGADGAMVLWHNAV
jgi:ribosome biogenesis protein ERB1